MRAMLLTFFAVLLLASAAQTKVLILDGKRMPGVVCHFIDAILRRHKPVRMARTTDLARIGRNRAAECGRIAGECARKLQACVDYPFATTYQGGAGARAKCVNTTEAIALGATVDAFYLVNKIRDGDKFNVLLTRIPLKCG